MNTSTDTLKKKEYQAFIASAKWRNIREAIINLRGRKCERCGHGSARFEVHHKTYERFGGRERNEDLEVLCHWCHVAADVEREKATKQENETAGYRAGFHTWMTKKYGEDYEPSAEDYERFDEWLERKYEQEW